MSKRKLVNISKYTNSGYSTRTEMFDGINYLVVPVVMMVEGVHAGSDGPMYHSIVELGRYVGSWDGIPVVVNHPEVDGSHVSANSPLVLEAEAVGKIFNTHVVGNKLKAEAWINPVKLTNINASALSSINSSELMEVSVGVFTDSDGLSGEWNGENYNSSALNHRPDHLALLPDATGACSTDDGCGLRVNKKKGETNVAKVTNYQVIKDLNKKGYQVNLMTLENGYEETIQLVRSALYAMDDDNKDYYLEELYETYVIFRLRDRNADTSGMYKQFYQINNDIVEFIGDPTKVKKKVTYIEVAPVNEPNILKRTKFNNKQKEEIMANEKCTPCIKAKANELITNASTNFEETDRIWLETMNEEQLGKFTPEPVAPVVNTTEVKEVEKTTPNTLSADDQHALDFGKRQLAAYRTNLINQIQANTEEGLWTPEVLNGMDETMLSNLAKSVGSKVDAVPDMGNYSLNGGKSPELETNNNSEPPMLPVGVGSETK